MYLELGIASVAIFGLLFLILGARRLGRRRFITGSLQGVGGLVLLAVAALMLSLLGNFYIYHRLTAEQPVAELRFHALGPRYYQALIRYPSGERHVLDVHGDEWQLDARILKWRGYATLVGFDSVYRLDRFSGRYRDIEQERRAVRSVHSLSQDPKFDLWMLAKRYSAQLPWVDTLYGSAAYMPLADNALYAVNVTNSGLIARPLNEAARNATEQWH